MIIIHINNNTSDAAILSKIYEDIDNITLCYNKNEEYIKQILKATGEEPVMLLGHGTPYGLLNTESDGFAVSEKHIKWLKNRPVIGIFCYASEFANKYDLHGFFTSMFISNISEAIIMKQSYQGITDKIISEQNILFCNRIHKLITDNISLDQWPSILLNQADLSLPFVKFNYEALFYI